MMNIYQERFKFKAIVFSKVTTKIFKKQKKFYQMMVGFLPVTLALFYQMDP